MLEKNCLINEKMGKLRKDGFALRNKVSSILTVQIYSLSDLYNDVMKLV